MSSLVLFTVAAVLVTSCALTALVRRFAISHGLMDIPNDRSSHKVATPRGGGVAMVLAASLAFGVLAIYGVISPQLAWALLVGGAAVAVIGWLDDRRPLPAQGRFAVHLAAAIWAVASLGGLPPIQVGELILPAGWLGAVLAVLGIVWTLNLFNFMDGIDGIAAVEATFVAGAATFIYLPAASAGVTSAAAVFCSAAVGFLPWNWPPARIFMGDVGSGYLGYVIAVMALAATVHDPVAVWVWLILGAVFFVDATVTLIRRTFRGERLHEAHRSHAYQWLARRWGRHLPVTLSVLAINILWLLPAAWLASHHPAWAAWIAVAALLPLIFLALAGGSGRSEQRAA